MTIPKKYDVRSVANRVLDVAWKGGLSITNLDINKIVYFVHVEYMRKYGVPLTRAKIEAWKHGPVFRELYGQFKRFGRNPITERAKKIDFDSGEYEDVNEVFPTDVAVLIDEVAEFYGQMPTGVLVDLTHVKGGAWDKVWNHEDSLNIGMEITQGHIERYEIQTGKRVRRMS